MISIYALLHRPGNGGVGWSSLFFYCLQTQGKTSALRLSVGIPIGLSDGIQGVKGFSTSVQRPSSRLAMIQQEPRYTRAWGRPEPEQTPRVPVLSPVGVPGVGNRSGSAV